MPLPVPDGQQGVWHGQEEVESVSMNWMQKVRLLKALPGGKKVKIFRRQP
jgi:hypothetical protein